MIERHPRIKMLKSIVLSIFIFLSFNVNANAAREDFYSWTWWSTQSGITTGTIIDIINKYLIGLGYTGDTMDMLHQWLVAETGLPVTYTTDDLLYYYYVTLNSCGALDSCGGGGSNVMTFNGVPMTFNGQTMTFSGTP